MFSTMTTEPSTISPKSMAPRLIRLPAIPSFTMKLTANSIDSGIESATMIAARMLPSKRKSTAMTRAAPSIRFVSTVLMVRCDRGRSGRRRP